MEHEAISPPSRELVDRVLLLAREAGEAGEVPVGALVYSVVAGGETVLGEGRNRIVAERDPSAHAELLAIRAACRNEASERLPGAALVSSLEPCLMCTGALVLARVEVAFYCSRAERGLGLGDVAGIATARGLGLNHSVRGHLLRDYEDDASALLRAFFRDRRGD